MDGQQIRQWQPAGAGSARCAAGAGLRDPFGDGDASAGRIRGGGYQQVHPLRFQSAWSAVVGVGGQGAGALEGRYNVSFEDIRRVYLPSMRHRILLNFEVQAENIPSDQVLLGILKEVKEKGPELAGSRG